MKTYTLKDVDKKGKSSIDYRKELNPEQYKVVTQGNGRVLVLAGPGSGKTRTLIYRTAYLLDTGVAPKNILLVTFTNKAAREMLSRVEILLKYHWLPAPKMNSISPSLCFGLTAVMERLLQSHLSL